MGHVCPCPHPRSPHLPCWAVWLSCVCLSFPRACCAGTWPGRLSSICPLCPCCIVPCKVYLSVLPPPHLSLPLLCCNAWPGWPSLGCRAGPCGGDGAGRGTHVRDAADVHRDRAQPRAAERGRRGRRAQKAVQGGSLAAGCGGRPAGGVGRAAADPETPFPWLWAGSPHTLGSSDAGVQGGIKTASRLFHRRAGGCEGVARSHARVAPRSPSSPRGSSTTCCSSSWSSSSSST